MKNRTLSFLSCRSENIQFITFGLSAAAAAAVEFAPFGNRPSLPCSECVHKCTHTDRNLEEGERRSKKKEGERETHSFIVQVETSFSLHVLRRSSHFHHKKLRVPTICNFVYDTQTMWRTHGRGSDTHSWNSGEWTIFFYCVTMFISANHRLISSHSYCSKSSWSAGRQQQPAVTACRRQS